MWVVFGERLVPCLRCKSVRGKTRLAMILSTRRLATRKNRDKIRIKDFGDQRDKGECQYTLRWLPMCCLDHWIIYLWVGIFDNWLRFIWKSTSIKVMLQNLGYQRFCVGKYFVFQRLANLKKRDGGVIVFITSVYCVLFVVIYINCYLIRSTSREFCIIRSRKSNLRWLSRRMTDRVRMQQWQWWVFHILAQTFLHGEDSIQLLGFLLLWVNNLFLHGWNEIQQKLVSNHYNSKLGLCPWGTGSVLATGGNINHLCSSLFGCKLACLHRMFAFLQ